MSVSAADFLGFDPTDPEFRSDPYSHYGSGVGLRRTPGGLWSTTDYGLCDQVLRDPSFGHGEIWEGDQRSFLTRDPPDHTRLRRLVSKAFTPRFVAKLRPRIEELVDELLGQASGEWDAIAGLAYPLPVILISELLGVPAEDRARFKTWSDALARGLDPPFLLPPDEVEAREEARLEFRAYFRELAAARREDPKDDLLSALVAVSDDGDRLSESELLATCVLLLVAGHETTVNLIGNGALALLRHPSQLAWFRARPQDVPAAIEELLRYDPPVQLTMRSALQDTVLDGHKIKQGEVLLLLTAAANRDPSIFPSPEKLDLVRPVRAHLSFGAGIHFCLGAPLARLEAEIALTKLFARNVSLTPANLTYRPNLVLRGLNALPLYLLP